MKFEWVLVILCNGIIIHYCFKTSVLHSCCFCKFCTDIGSSTCDRFAADVFHGLQEQATNTSSRSHKLMVRAKKIEAAISPLEKSILAQRSHLHFAYTTGMAHAIYLFSI